MSGYSDLETGKLSINNFDKHYGRAQFARRSAILITVYIHICTGVSTTYVLLGSIYKNLNGIYRIRFYAEFFRDDNQKNRQQIQHPRYTVIYTVC